MNDFVSAAKPQDRFDLTGSAAPNPFGIVARVRRQPARQLDTHRIAHHQSVAALEASSDLRDTCG
jgi:hypothetical protein